VPVSWIPRQHLLISSILLTGAQQTPQTTVGGTALPVGTALDGVPENEANGVGLVTNGQGLVLVLLEAVSPGKLPANMSSEVGVHQKGRTGTYIIPACGEVAVACTLATVLADCLIFRLSPNLTGAMLALAGGIPALLTDTMTPMAFQNGGPFVALATAAGFACDFLLSHLLGPAALAVQCPGVRGSAAEEVLGHAVARRRRRFHQ